MLQENPFGHVTGKLSFRNNIEAFRAFKDDYYVIYYLISEEHTWNILA
jgi:hypothetical protein